MDEDKAKLSQTAYRLALLDAVRDSIIAEVALLEDAGVENTWPRAFREAAVAVYNERAEAGTPNPARRVGGGPPRLSQQRRVHR